MSTSDLFLDPDLADWQSGTTSKVVSQKDAIVKAEGEEGYQRILGKAQARDRAASDAYYQFSQQFGQNLAGIQDTSSSKPYLAAAQSALSGVQNSRARKRIESEIADLSDSAVAWTALRRQFATTYGDPETAIQEYKAAPNKAQGPAADALEGLSDFWGFHQDLQRKIENDRAANPKASEAERFARVALTTPFGQALQAAGTDDGARVGLQFAAGLTGTSTADYAAQQIAKRNPMMTPAEAQQAGRYAAATMSYLKSASSMEDWAAQDSATGKAPTRAAALQTYQDFLSQAQPKLQAMYDALPLTVQKAQGVPLPPPAPHEVRGGLGGLVDTAIRALHSLAEPQVHGEPGAKEAYAASGPLLHPRLEQPETQADRPHLTPQGQAIASLIGQYIPGNKQALLENLVQLGAMAGPFGAAGAVAELTGAPLVARMGAKGAAEGAAMFSATGSPAGGLAGAVLGAGGPLVGEIAGKARGVGGLRGETGESSPPAPAPVSQAVGPPVPRAGAEPPMPQAAAPSPAPSPEAAPAAPVRPPIPEPTVPGPTQRAELARSEALKALEEMRAAKTEGPLASQVRTGTAERALVPSSPAQEAAAQALNQEMAQGGPPVPRPDLIQKMQPLLDQLRAEQDAPEARSIGAAAASEIPTPPVAPPETLSQKTKGLLKKIPGSVIQNVTAGDWGTALRTSFWVAPKNPVIWARAMFKDQAAYYTSREAYAALNRDLVQRPTYPMMQEGGLALTSLSGGASQEERQAAESIFGQLASLRGKDPLSLVGRGWGEFVEAGNRAYSGSLTKLRADLFDDMYNRLQTSRLRRPVEGQLFETVSKEDIRDIAQAVNAMTGRGSLAGLEKIGGTISSGIFSPRYQAAILRTMNPLTYTKASPYGEFARKEMTHTMFAFVGAMSTFLGGLKLASTLPQFRGQIDVEADPRSADFGKFRIGKTRFDLLAGRGQYLRTAARILPWIGGIKSSTTGAFTPYGKFGGPTRLSTLEDFATTKASPIPGFAMDLLRGNQMGGEPATAVAEARKLFIPMFLNDMIDVARTDPTLIPLAAPLTFFGAGTSTYPTDTSRAMDSALRILNRQGKPDAALSHFMRQMRTAPSKAQRDAAKVRAENRARHIVASHGWNQ